LYILNIILLRAY